MTNVIDSLTEFNNDRSLGELFQRWLPEIETLGLYLSSSGKERDAKRKGYFYLLKTRGLGSQESLHSKEFIKSAENNFLTQSRQFFEETINDVAAAKKWIHKRLKETHDQLISMIDCAIELKQVNDVIQSSGGIDQLKQKIVVDKQQLADYDEQLLQLKDLKKTWLDYRLKEMNWLSILLQVPVIGRWFQNRNQLKLDYFVSHYIDFPLESPHQEQAITEAIEQWTIEKKNLRDKLKKSLDKQIAFVNHIKTLEPDWRAFFSDEQWAQIDVSVLYELTNQKNPLVYLDTHHRKTLFYLAMHYWEACWLIAIRKLQINNFKEGYGVPGRKKYFQRFAMLFPCFVTTMQSGLSFFRHRSNSKSDYQYLIENIDLLIVDEAGQVNPALAGGLVALEKRAIFVGDRQQLEPIANIPEEIDKPNVLESGLIHHRDAYSSCIDKGILVSGKFSSIFGSAMHIAQRMSPYHQCDQEGKPLAERGMQLLEHWRCVPEIIQYCNQLCYQNQLILNWPSKTDYPCLALGYAHIKGECVQAEGGSRKNEFEAQVMIDWIVDNQSRLLYEYRKQLGGKLNHEVILDDIVGIVTPFSAQKHYLLNLCRQRDLSIKKIGTVHALQGAEKPVVLFSPVYTRPYNGTLFFDIKNNMLNVALSRAKDCFLVFGDMDY